MINCVHFLLMVKTHIKMCDERFFMYIYQIANALQCKVFSKYCICTLKKKAFKNVCFLLLGLLTLNIDCEASYSDAN